MDFNFGFGVCEAAIDNFKSLYISPTSLFANKFTVRPTAPGFHMVFDIYYIYSGFL
jgi:hypothetical protein